MAVRKIDSNGDWTFGRGKANYIKGSDEIKQNVATRIRSFQGDCFLDIEQGIPWIDLLSNKGTERRILRAIEKTIMQTVGVVSVSNIRIVETDSNRNATIEASYTDVYGQNITSLVDLL